MKIRARNPRRAAIRAGIVVGIPALLLLATFTMPVHEWRTGRLPAEPLPMIEGPPDIDVPSRIWVDTDAACGHGRTVDPDDCLAILMLLRAPALHVAGISSVHGNADLGVTDRTTRELVRRIGVEHGPAPAVYAGAAGPLDKGIKDTPAHRAMTQALERGPLTLVALGPLTNVAAVLNSRPALRTNVSRLVSVMGRRPGHIFHPSEGRGDDAALFGHGPVFRDFNFAKDPLAARRVLAMGLPLTLVPYEAAKDVEITARDLDTVASGGGAPSWVARAAHGWLDYWKEDIGLDGFYPFDALAAAWVLRADLVGCADVNAWVGEDPRINWAPSGPNHLLVGLEKERPPDVLAAGRVLYCPRAGAGAHAALLGLLSGDATRSFRGPASSPE